MTQQDLHDAVIVGGGLAGMSASVALRMAGVKDVVVLESASRLKEVGAGIQITPNASRILQNWGLTQQLESTAVRPRDCFLRRWQTGGVLTKFNLTPAHYNDHGAPFYDFHRADLHEALIDKAQELGVVVRCSSKVERVDYDTGVVTVEGYGAIGARLVVAADGLYSTCRSALSTAEEQPSATGDIAYRIVLTRDQLADDPDLLKMVDSPQVNYWVGPDSHVVSYVLRGGQLLNIVLLCPDDTAEHIRRVDGDVSEMRQIFADWDPQLRRLLDRVPSVMKWKLKTRPPARSWLHRSGKFLMIGDAAHTMLPYLSQGAAIALEDAAVLGEVVKRVGLTHDSLKLYERLRQRRAEKVVAHSEYQRKAYHMHDGRDQQLRDSRLAQAPHVGDFWQWRDPVFAKWLYGYDYVQEVSDAVATWNY